MSEETEALQSVEEIGIQEIFVANKEHDEHSTAVQEIFTVCNGTHTEQPTAVQEIFTIRNGTHNESSVLPETHEVGDVTTEPNIVGETLHVIAMSENNADESSAAMYVGNGVEGNITFWKLIFKFDTIYSNFRGK